MRKGDNMRAIREGLIKGSFAAGAFASIIGICAVDENPVAGLFLFIAGGAWALLIAAQNGGLE